MDKNDEVEINACSFCNSNNVERVQENYTFSYGMDKDSVELTALVLVIKCNDCGMKFLDSAAQDLCHKAVCKHLGVMAPVQIQNLREKYYHTNEIFAEFVGITKDKLSLWERGMQIQNKAYDNLLYLLGFEDNFQRLIDRREK